MCSTLWAASALIVPLLFLVVTTCFTLRRWFQTGRAIVAGRAPVLGLRPSLEPTACGLAPALGDAATPLGLTLVLGVLEC